MLYCVCCELCCQEYPVRQFGIVVDVLQDGVDSVLPVVLPDTFGVLLCCMLGGQERVFCAASGVTAWGLVCCTLRLPSRASDPLAPHPQASPSTPSLC